MDDVNSFQSDFSFNVLIYMQLNYLKLLLKMGLLFHYVYLVKWNIPNTLNGGKKKKTKPNKQGFGCLYINRIHGTHFYCAPTDMILVFLELRIHMQRQTIVI